MAEEARRALRRFTPLLRPDMTNTRTIAHIADLHLSPAMKTDAVDAFRAAAAIAIERRADAFVIAGDLWDRAVRLEAAGPVMPAIRIVRDIADAMPVVIVKGNHDPEGSLELFAELAAAHPVVVATAPQVAEASGVQFFCLPYPTKAFLVSQVESPGQDETDAIVAGALRAIIAGFAAWRRRDLPAVLVFHGSVTGAATETGQVMLGGDILVSAADLEMSGAEYVALGHIHKRQVLGSRCYYPGSTCHVNFGEIEPKYMNIVTIAPGADPHVEAVRLPSRPKVVVDLLPDGTTAEPLDLRTIDGADVKIRARMTEEQAATFDADAAAASIRERAYSVTVERIVIPRERIRSEAVTAVTALRDKVNAWGTAVGEEIPDGVLSKADVIEAAVVVGAGGVR